MSSEAGHRGQDRKRAAELWAELEIRFSHELTEFRTRIVELETENEKLRVQLSDEMDLEDVVRVCALDDVEDGEDLDTIV